MSPLADLDFRWEDAGAGHHLGYLGTRPVARVWASIDTGWFVSAVLGLDGRADWTLTPPPPVEGQAPTTRFVSLDVAKAAVQTHLEGLDPEILSAPLTAGAKKRKTKTRKILVIP